MKVKVKKTETREVEVDVEFPIYALDDNHGEHGHIMKTAYKVEANGKVTEISLSGGFPGEPEEMTLEVGTTDDFGSYLEYASWRDRAPSDAATFERFVKLFREFVAKNLPE